MPVKPDPVITAINGYRAASAELDKIAVRDNTTLLDRTFEKTRLQYRSEVAHWVNLARENLKALVPDSGR